ncbi:BREX system ATP-binding protein BrxD [bacterium]|nr:BREX system ATP-binding protein BrxD [bacterium]
MTYDLDLSPQRRGELLDALRRGTVPATGLDALANGLERFVPVLTEELGVLRSGRGLFKALRGDYGCGKTFFARWFQEYAKREGFAAAEVQISEQETPLHRLETIYRRLIEHLSTADCRQGALRSIIDGWFYTLEEAVLASGEVSDDDEKRLLAATHALMEKRLVEVSRSAPAFSACLRAYREAVASGDNETAEGLIAWLGGQPNVAASVKRQAGIKGDLDHFAALSFLQGLLVVLRDSGHGGLVLVLDEIETLQRVRSDVREKSLNALRQLMDEIEAGRFPGLYLLITGTPAFYDGPQGVQRLAPLAQRLHVEFLDDARWDNPRAVQIRLPAFDMARLQQVGRRVRDLFAQNSAHADRVQTLVGDDYVADLAASVTGKLGGKVGVAPRIFLKKLVGEVLDRVDLFPDFDPRRDYRLNLSDSELSRVERAATEGGSVNAIELELEI